MMDAHQEVISPAMNAVLDHGKMAIPKDDSRSGHNSQEVMLRIEVRLFNTLVRYAKAGHLHQQIEVAAGTTVGDLIRLFKLPVTDIFLVLRNGRDITPGLYGGGVVNENVVVDNADVIAFSGPVPYSYGYGAPVV
jgi:hypothetical protein